MWRCRPIAVVLIGFLLAAGIGQPLAALREPVHPRRNVEEFPPVEAKFVRFVILATNELQPCLDELEIFSDEAGLGNVALHEKGARATACGSLPGYAIHRLGGVNDGLYGNGQSWIADRIRDAWVQIELPRPIKINRVIWSRDREGNFIDRLATEYRVEVALHTNEWRVVASSADRQPLAAGAELSHVLTPGQQFLNRIAPAGPASARSPARKPAEYAIDIWQTFDGLPGNTVTAITQSPDGYLWVGTLNGLARFDGLRFNVLREADGLPDGRVLCLLSDRRGELWAGTESGGLIKGKPGAFQRLTRKDGLPSDTITALAEGPDGSIWIGSKNGLIRWQHGQLNNDSLSFAPANTSVSKVLCSQNNQLWCVVPAGLFAAQGGRMVPARHDDEPSAFSSLFAAHLGPSGTLWFGGANGYIGSLAHEKVQIFREPPGEALGTVWDLLETRNGDVWAGTANSGLKRLRAGQYLALSTADGLSDNSILCLFEDREASLWAGTVRGGLIRLKASKLSTFTSAHGLAHDSVMSLAEDADHTLWIGSHGGGLSALRGGELSPYYVNYLIDNESILSLHGPPGGGLWVGTRGGGLFFLRGRQVDYFASALGPNHGPVLALCGDGQEGVWVGTKNAGLKHILKNGKAEEPHGHELPLTTVNCILRDSDASLWIGTDHSGVWNSGKESPRQYTRADGLPSDAIRTLYRDGAGALWIGTSGGLGRLIDGRVDSFTKANGLPDEVISQILEDDQRNLWLGSNQGIFRISRGEFDAVSNGIQSQLNLICYGRTEGMETLECTGGFQPAGLRDHAGKLWFSTAKGLVLANPAALPVNHLPPPVVIEEILLDGKPAPVPTEAVEKGLECAPDTQRIEFHFSALSLEAPERNRFKYQLEGLDPHWVGPTFQRAATYTHLSPGTYRFRVMASNNDGTWNEAGAAIPFVVLPHFWQHWWFQASAVLALAAAAATVARLTAVRRLHRSLRQLEEQNALEKERTRIAQDIHDELGASLTGITLLTELGQKHRNNPDEVAAEFGKISAMARDAVRAMDAIVWAVNPRNDSLDHFANYISQFAEEFLRPAGIRCRLDVPADLPEHALSTEERHQLFLAVKEALNNVVRHSGSTEVWLRLSVEEGEITITIEDNGRGLAHHGAAANTRNGLSNMRERLERLGGHASMGSIAGMGTTIRLHLPIPENRKEVVA